uniref:Uncharacterized protein n=1 Tax=Bionectria ochroleuca TaxID=29856 RepID=A0A8H7TKE0_BIOOC
MFDMVHWTIPILHQGTLETLDKGFTIVVERKTVASAADRYLLLGSILSEAPTLELRHGPVLVAVLYERIVKVRPAIAKLEVQSYARFIQTYYDTTHLQGKINMGDQQVHSEARAIVQKMTIEDKAAFLTGHRMWRTHSLDHLGVRALVMTDGTHGVRYSIPQIDEDQPAGRTLRPFFQW